MHATLSIRLLGGFALVYQGAPLVITSPRLQALLAYLALHDGEPQPRRRLAFLLWPDSSEAQAQTNLRTVLHRSQRALPSFDTFLHIDAQTIAWAPGQLVVLDVQAFQNARQQGAAAEASGDEASALAAFDRAVVAYTGDLLPDCYDEWMQPARAQLRDGLLDSLARLATLFERRRDYAAALTHARHLIRLEPLNEATYLTLMRLHAFSGDHSGALRIYHTCTTTLQQELGTLPGTALQSAHAQLIAADHPPEHETAAIAPLVGQRVVWQRMQAVWQRATAGRPLVLLLAGEAGIGKTRLAEEFVRWVARQGGMTATARCYPAEGMLAYAPLVTWLRTDTLHPSVSQLDPRWLVELMRLDPELITARQDLPAPGPLAAAWQRQRLFEALARAVLAAGRPTVLLIDDLQWCDRDTLEWLHYLMRYDPRARLLVVGTLRQEELDGAHPLATLLEALRGEERMIELALGPLSSGESAELAGQVARYALRPDQCAQVYAETEGNPLFIVEMVRAGIAGSSATVGIAGGQPARDTTSPPLPAGVQAVLSRRLQQVSPSAHDLLEMAAVVGRFFTFDVLAHAVEIGEDALVRGLDELWQRRIVREHGPDAYDFTHDKLRAVAYGSLSSARRRRLHARVARALEAVSSANLDAVSGQIATHYERAGKLEQAAAYERRAADVAHRLYANLDAIKHYRRAITLLGTGHPVEVAALQNRVGDLLHLLGRYEDARQAWEQARAAMPAAESIDLAHLLRKIGNAFRDEYRYEHARRAYVAAEAALPATADRSNERTAQVWAQIQLEWIALDYWLGEVDAMLRRVEQVRPVLESLGDPAQQARFHQIQAIAAFRRDRYNGSPEAIGHARAYLDTVQAINDLDTVPSAQFQLGFALLWSGALDQAEQQINDALDVAERGGDRSLEGRCITYLTVIARLRGDTVRAHAYARQSMGVAEANQMYDYIGAAHGNLAWVAWRAGNLPAAHGHGQAALEAWGHLPAGYIFEWTARWPLIGAALADGDTAGALEHARLLLDERQQRPPHSLELALEAALHAAQPGNLAAAATLLNAARGTAQSLGYL